jgi:sugar/nucleoside kinase (ribokinase family)
MPHDEIQVFGPAYLDRVLRVDRSLTGEGRPPLDQSVEGVLTFGEGLRFRDPSGVELTVAPPPDWPGPFGVVTFEQALEAARAAWPLSVQGVSWQDDLGGMGAGFAAALGGVLISALGPEDDPVSVAVAALLKAAGIAHRPIRVPHQPADWTLLLTSGPFGDKLPVGFRGCHAAVPSVGPWCETPCDVRVVSSLPNPLAAEALRADGARIRVFAPAMRNMTDRALPVGRFASQIDILCCNRKEWESLDDRESVAWQVSVLAVTDGPDGASIRFTTPEGEPGHVHVPAFPRSSPPRDTNRAGEAFASTLLRTLLRGGWRPGTSEPSLIQVASERASAASALVLDQKDFGFPSEAAIDEALRAGRV